MTIERMPEDLLAMFRRVGRKVQHAIEPLCGTVEGAEELSVGAGGDITVRIDSIAEQTALEELKAGLDDFRLMTEEAGFIEVGTPDMAVIMDPLDGSLNAKRGLPLYSISIAAGPLDPAFEDIRIGYVRNLATGDEFWAIKDEGFYKNDKRLENRAEPELLVLGTEMFPEVGTCFDATARAMAMAKRVRGLGSIALDLALVAEGSLSGFIDLRDCGRTLDLSAGYLLMVEAGAVVTDSDGVDINAIPIVFNNWTNIVAAGHPDVHGLLLDVISGE